MRLINVNSLKPGEQLSSPIRMQDGRVLLPAKAVITESYLKRLKGFGIVSVYIDDEFFDDVQIKPCLSDETKTMALNAISDIYQRVASKKDINETSIKKATRELVSDVKSAMTEPINLFNMYAVNDPRCLHAVNVATIVAALALEHGCNYTATEQYVTAALLHDIMLDKMDDDKNLKHADAAYEFLKSQRSFSVRTYMSVAMHHERYDGKGGPKGLSGDQISEGARMIAIADTYDNLIYGYSIKKQNLNLAVEFLNMESEKSLDPVFLKYFNRAVAIYPTGCTVVLNNGLKAIVTEQNEKMPARPIVRLCMPNREDCLRFNLLTQRTVFIEKIEL